MTLRNQALEWLRFAQRDGDSARFLTQQRPMPTEIICFHCQQAAEKALKALLVDHGEPVPKIHDLQKLHRLLMPQFPELKDFEEHCLVLTGYGSMVRYPFNLEVPESQVLQSIQFAEEILAFIRSILTKRNDK